MEDAEASYLYFTIAKWHWSIDEFPNLPVRKKAFVIATIDKYLKESKT